MAEAASAESCVIFFLKDEEEKKKLASPLIMNELVYVLCCLKPGEFTGKSICAQNWLDDQTLNALYRKFLPGKGDERRK